MAQITQTGFPPVYINGYIVAQLKEFGILSGYEQMNPILPTTPTNIEDLFKNYIGAPGDPDPLLIQYEKLARFRPNSLYRHKRDQLVYYVYSTNLEKMFNATRIIIEALDREDAAAQDVNSWMIENKEDFEGTLNVLFHNIKVYQTDESRDILNSVSARIVHVNKIIIEYDYHTTQSYYN